MNPELPKYPPVIKKPEELDPVAKSIAKPGAFSKPGSMDSKPGHAPKGPRFRPLVAKRGPGRRRIHPKDPRSVEFY